MNPSIVIVGIALCTSTLIAAEPKAPGFCPLMAVPDRRVLEDDFSKPHALDKSTWQARQGTQWAIADGLLRGKPSSAEYQASKTDHAGKEPRIAVPVTPQDFIARLSVRFSGGAETPVTPFIEFGHHVCRLRFSESITELLAAHDALRVNEAQGFHYKPGVWYHLLAERRGDEIVIQIADGPTLYAKHASIAEAPASGGDGLGIAGPRDGVAEIDNLMIYSVKKNAVQPEWETTKKKLPSYKPVVVEKKGKAKK